MTEDNPPNPAVEAIRAQMFIRSGLLDVWERIVARAEQLEREATEADP